MSVHSEVKAAVDGFGYPFAANIYAGTEDTYFVLTVCAQPDNFADDAPQADRAMVSLSLYCPHTTNTVALRKAVRRALFLAGFTYPSEVDASDETAQHIVFEFEAAEEA